MKQAPSSDWYSPAPDRHARPPHPIRSHSAAAVPECRRHDRPSRALMAVLDTFNEAGDVILTVDQPSTTLAARYVVNGPVKVPAGGRGVCYEDSPVPFAYDSGYSASVGDFFGPDPGSWLAKYGSLSLLCVQGVIDTSYVLALGQFTQPRGLIGIPGSTVAALSGSTPGSGSFTIQNIASGALSATTMTVTGYNLTASALAASVPYQLVEMNGLWFAGAAAAPGGVLIFKATATTALLSTDSTVAFTGGLVSITPATAL